MKNGNSDMTRLERLICGEPIKATCGAVLYPIKMRQYAEWSECKNALLIRQTTLPVQYVVKPYLSALFALDADTGFILGLTQSLRTLISMATLRPLEEIGILVSAQNQNEITAISYKDGDTVIRIEPKDFPEIRRIIADQNDEELPDESENPELVQAEKDIAALNAPKLKYDMETMLESVSYVARVPMRELLGMTIRSFMRLRKAIDRDKMFMIYTQASMSGFVKFKEGNPVPSWCFDKIEEGSAGVETLAAFAARTGITINPATDT